jgi:putative oxidoreductase
MDNWADIFAPLIGRILMGGFFLWEGIISALNFPNTAATFATIGSPSPVVLAAIAIGIEVLCGIALVVGIECRIASLILVVFVIASAFIQPVIQNEASQAFFLQNMAIVGGLLYVSAYGSGAWSPAWRYRR